MARTSEEINGVVHPVSNFALQLLDLLHECIDNLALGDLTHRLAVLEEQRASLPACNTHICIGSFARSVYHTAHHGNRNRLLARAEALLNLLGNGNTVTST